MGGFRNIWLLGILLVPFVGFTQNPLDQKTIPDSLRDRSKFELIGIPVVFYTPETQFGIGGGGQLFLPEKINRFNQRLSVITFSGVYTTNGQIMFEVTPEVYLGGGNYFLDFNYLFEIYPNSFWGIGPDTPASAEEFYDQTTHKLDVNLLKRLPPDLNFGLSFHFANHQVTEVEDGGILDSGSVEGSDRAVISGIGAIFNLDSRDDPFSARAGELIKLNARFSSQIFGATHDFNKFIFDMRAYRKLTERGVLALRLYVESNFGDVPFQGLATYGGSASARGYFYGRFLDKHLYTAQAEYRWRFRPRWTLAGFGLFGEVANDADDLFEFKNVKPSLGGGIRYKILQDKNVWIRLDYGKGIDGQSGIYFGINEAF